MGGEQWKHIDAILKTRLEEELKKRGATKKSTSLELSFSGLDEDFKITPATWAELSKVWATYYIHLFVVPDGSAKGKSCYELNSQLHDLNLIVAIYEQTVNDTQERGSSIRSTIFGNQEEKRLRIENLNNAKIKALREVWSKAIVGTLRKGWFSEILHDPLCCEIFCHTVLPILARANESNRNEKKTRSFEQFCALFEQKEKSFKFPRYTHSPDPYTRIKNLMRIYKDKY